MSIGASARTFAALLLLASCQGSVTRPSAPPGPVNPSLVVRGTEFPLRSEQWHFSAEIPFAYTNQTADTIANPGCRTPAPPRLQWWTGTEWAAAFDVAELMCLGEPYLLAPGATYSDTLRFQVSRDSIGPDGNPVAPHWRGPRNTAEYRLIWNVHDLSPNRAQFETGPPRPEAERVSRPFRLVIDLP